MKSRVWLLGIKKVNVYEKGRIRKKKEEKGKVGRNKATFASWELREELSKGHLLEVPGTSF